MIDSCLVDILQAISVAERLALAKLTYVDQKIIA